VNIALWTLQILMGLFFILASGAPKLLLPAEMLPMPIPLPAWFMTFTGVVEILGGLGLILPGLLRIRPGLTPLAAGGLALVALGGAVYQVAAGELGNAVFALVFVLLCAFIGYGRWQLHPHRDRAQQTALQPARQA
jgi:uncharacterized membrane protein YphA (DoxX/SURF4 family)